MCSKLCFRRTTVSVLNYVQNAMSRPRRIPAEMPLNFDHSVLSILIST